MRVAFYAPLKSPTHPVPCGDRQLARLMMQALRVAGHKPELASEFRSWDRGGDRARQRRLHDIGQRLAERLVRRFNARAPGRRPRVWFTCHCYYKAPDWLGPHVAAACAMPYVVAAPSYAPKREGGAWSLGHGATRDSIERADAVIAINSRDVDCLMPLLADPARLVRLPPFMDAADLPPRSGRVALRRRFARALDISEHEPWIVAVGMMRERDKLASYRMLGEALGRLQGRPWRLIVVGDGRARGQVEAAFARWPASRVVFTGARPRQEVLELMVGADLYAWPAINEGCGYALLEAQMAALPVVAGDYGGVPDIVRDAHTGLITEPGNAIALADAVALLLDDVALRERLGRSAYRVARRDHDLDAAASRLRATLARISSR